MLTGADGNKGQEIVRVTSRIEYAATGIAGIVSPLFVLFPFCQVVFFYPLCLTAV